MALRPRCLNRRRARLDMQKEGVDHGAIALSCRPARRRRRNTKGLAEVSREVGGIGEPAAFADVGDALRRVVQQPQAIAQAQIPGAGSPVGKAVLMR